MGRGQKLRKTLAIGFGLYLLYLLILGNVYLYTHPDWVDKIQQKYWIYKAEREPQKYGTCKECGLLKPHKIMDCNTMTCDKCMGVE